ncbi:MAG: hypothetical protein IKC07_01125 [Clostridia bacterium]|nr:hypothetical protein [Clostridia bacterium]
MNNNGSFAWRYGAVLARKKDIAILWQSGAVLNVKVNGPNASEFNYELYQSILTVINNYDSFQKNKPIFSILPFLNNGKRGEITPVNTINNIAKTEQKFYKNPQDNQFLDMVKNAKAYGQIIIYKPVFYGETDFSREIIVNEYETHN